MSEIATPAAAPAAPASAPASTPSAPAAQSRTAADFRQRLLQGSSGDLPSLEGTSADSPQDEATPILDEQSQERLEESEPVADEAPDYSWAEPLGAYKDGLHGVQLQELLQALSEGRLPDALLDKINLTLKDGDVEWEDSIAGMRDGAMMRANYTKKLQSFAKERDAFMAERNELVSYMHSWQKDPAAFLAGAQKMGFPVEGMARLFAEKLMRMDALKAKEEAGEVPKGTVAALEAAEAREAELAELKMEKERLAQQQTQQQEKASTEQVVEAVRTESMRQLTAAGLDMSGPGAQGIWNMFYEQVSAVWSAKGAPPSRLEITECVRATKELHNKYVQQARAQAAAKPQAPKMTAQRLDGGAPSKAPAARRGMTAADFRAKLRAGQFGQ